MTRRCHGHPVPGADEAALLRAIHADPLEDTPRLMYADMVEERGDTTLAEFIRMNIERCRNPGRYYTDFPFAQRYAQIEEYCTRKLVRPKPRGMHFVRIDHGLPLVAACHPADDLDDCANRMQPHYCVQLVLSHVHPAGYQPALRHPVMAQVHCVQMHAVDEYDVLALSETACAGRPVRVLAPVITAAAYAAARELLPKVTLVRVPPRRSTRRLRHALGLHRHRFDP